MSYYPVARAHAHTRSHYRALTSLRPRAACRKVFKSCIRTYPDRDIAYQEALKVYVQLLCEESALIELGPEERRTL